MNSASSISLRTLFYPNIEIEFYLSSNVETEAEAQEIKNSLRNLLFNADYVISSRQSKGWIIAVLYDSKI